ncbi:hypothetical protein JB92DRAFT_3141670 [Gautieria morchelliformis]|nr:hypothetical protein JB92DRAFT_3141670 [Gautieria morchelliformis]
MSNQLPLEVCKRIVEHLLPMYDNPAIAALARTSRALHPIAEEHLYSSLYSLGDRMLHAILQAFTSRPIRTSYPRQLFIRPPEHERAPQTYWNQLSDVLKLCGADLKLLCIVGNDPEFSSASWVLRSLRDMPGRLRVLRSPFWWDTEVVGFLESDGARNLTRLENGDVPGVALEAQQMPSALSLRRDAVANLTQVDAPPSALCLLVPGRPVTHVRLRLGQATTLHTLPPAMYLLKDCLMRSTAPNGVIALDLGDLTPSHPLETYSIEVLELAPSFLPHLKFIGTINFPWTKDVPATRIYKPLLRLPELHILEFVVSHIHPPVDSYWELSMACEFRTFSPSLRELVFWQGYDRHRWIWLEHEVDFVLAAQEPYPIWGGV